MNLDQYLGMINYVGLLIVRSFGSIQLDYRSIGEPNDIKYQI